MNSGLGCFRIGSDANLCDWLYVDNLAHALHCAADKLLALAPTVKGKGRAGGPAGRAYFVSDRHPVNNFDWVAAMLGQPTRALFPLAVPASVMYCIAILCEFGYRIAFLVGAFRPLLAELGCRAWWFVVHLQGPPLKLIWR